MEFRTKFKYGDYVFVYRNSVLQKYQIVGVTIRQFSPTQIGVEYRLWTTIEEIGMPEESCFANEDEVRADLEKRFEELNK